MVSVWKRIPTNPQTLDFTGVFGFVFIILYGELIAMQWKHVDFDKKELHVRQAVKRVATSDDMGNIVSRGSKLGKLKTKSSLRNIAIPSALLETV